MLFILLSIVGLAYGQAIRTIDDYQCTFTVLSIDHRWGTIGQYFNFDVSTVAAILGTGTTFTSQSTYNVFNSRTGVVSLVILWSHANGGTIGDGHGRKNLGALPGDWLVGDVLAFDDVNPQFCDATDAPTKFPTKYPTSTPSKMPSDAPTKFPTKYPTSTPSKMPSESPIKAPTTSPVPECFIDNTATFDWNTLTRDGTNVPNVEIVDMSVNSDDLSLNIEVEVDYIVNAFADYQPTPNFGTTYVLDFEDFDAHKSSIALPGSCSNRLERDYTNIENSDHYFSITSEHKDDIGTAANMCYPPTDGTGWTIDLDASTCQTIKYVGKWTWQQLRDCRNNLGETRARENGERQTLVDDGDNWLTLSGTFYVNMVSPYWYENNADYGNFYRVYQLVSQPFVIQVSKSVYVIGDTGINVMTMSVIAVYKEDSDSQYTLVLLTETAEYMQLKDAMLVSYTGLTGAGDMNTHFSTLAALSDAETGTANEDCLNNKGFICSQLWKVFATETSCDSVGGTDFSGTYKLKFEPQCRTGNGVGNGYDFNEHCTDWLSTHDQFDNGVVLQSDLVFVDQICDPRIFTVQLGAVMAFYENADYTGLIGEGSPHLYQVGVDTVYVEITLTFPPETESIFDSTLINVWLCTFAPNTAVSDPSQNGPDTTDDYVNADNGGCFSADRDGFGDANSDFFFHIYGPQSGIASEEDFDLGVSGANEQIRFSFTVPNEIERDTLYVHAQVEVSLEELDRRRRVLLGMHTGKTSNKMSHFGQQIGIGKKRSQKPKPEVPNGPNINVPNNGEPVSGVRFSAKWVMIIAGLLSVVLVFNIVLMCYMKCCKRRNGRGFISLSKHRRNGYDSVKYIDSNEEHFGDSDQANLIEMNLSEANQ